MCLVNKHGLTDALRGMGQSEREIQQLLASISVSRGKHNSSDEESLDYNSDVSIIDEMGPMSSKTFRKLKTPTRQVPRCWHGSRCPWHRKGRCLFQHSEASESLVTGETNFKTELNALWIALRKLAASLMWRTGTSLGPNTSATLANNVRTSDRNSGTVPMTDYATPPSTTYAASAHQLLAAQTFSAVTTCTDHGTQTSESLDVVLVCNQLQIIENIVETPDFQCVRGSRTPERLGTAPGRHVAFFGDSGNGEEGATPSFPCMFLRCARQNLWLKRPVLWWSTFSLTL